ncbi:MAG: HAMP domain-containing histidine kinase [Solobacterium sp.]|nr:HAMP domain-containing histidine kinase [Solobacterium sp.]
MKLDRHGIRFNIWLFFLLFAVGIVLMLGILQFSLVRPYYRSNQVRTVEHVADELENSLLNENRNQEDIEQANRTVFSNNVCVQIINGSGTVVYRSDNIGNGCVFNLQDRYVSGSPVSLRDTAALSDYLQQNGGLFRLNVVNERTGQEMVVLGRKVAKNLSDFYVYINSPLEPVDSLVSFFSRQYAFFTLIVILLASMISLWISGRLSDPIRHMNQEAVKLARADYSASFEGGYFTETADLASTLNDATQKLNRIDDLRKDLIANVSHDIKTPLTSIKAYAEMIKDFSGDIPEKRNDHLDVIISETDYLNRLVNDMSELSMMQSGNYILNYGNFDICEVIRTVVRLNGVLIEDAGLNIRTEMPESLMMYADETKIAQVVNNYLSNAIKHTPQGGTITVRVQLLKDEETIRVEVIDEGEGIAENEIPFIWDRYQKTSRSFSRTLTNTGIGLAIVKAILDTHGARYGVASTVGKGSLFWFEMTNPQEEESFSHD